MSPKQFFFKWGIKTGSLCITSLIDESPGTSERLKKLCRELADDLEKTGETVLRPNKK